MKSPTLSKLNSIRNDGLRPQIVACIIRDKKILFLYKKEHNLWQLPQGGIENGETMEIAFFREMNEELGKKFTKSFNKDISLIDVDKSEFPEYSTGFRKILNDSGQEILMKGKKYFFISTQTNADIIIKHSEFDDFKWVSYKESLILCEKIYQKGKKRITVKALKKLKKCNIL